VRSSLEEGVPRRLCAASGERRRWPMAGSRRPENWSVSSGVPGRSYCWGRLGQRTASESCRREVLGGWRTTMADSVLGGWARSSSMARGRSSGAREWRDRQLGSSATGAGQQREGWTNRVEAVLASRAGERARLGFV
jgi:hypothetical protein